MFLSVQVFWPAGISLEQCFTRELAGPLLELMLVQQRANFPVQWSNACNFQQSHPFIWHSAKAIQYSPIGLGLSSS